jgi:ribonuclease HI
MSKKHYVVWKGAKTGIFDSWPEAKSQIDGRSDAQYMGFGSLNEAQAAFKSTYTKALMKRSLAKHPGSTSAAAPKSNTKRHTSAKASSSRSPQLTADINIYCDGACSPNPGKSGTGIAVYEKQQIKELWYGRFLAHGTNNTAELTGLLEAFILAKKYIEQDKQVQILSDSKYSIDCITKWATGWKNKGWTRGKGEEIKNLELIKQCHSLYGQLKSHLTIAHVKGHANIEGNELADRMAVLARMTQESNFVLRGDKIDINSILAMPSG